MDCETKEVAREVHHFVGYVAAVMAAMMMASALSAGAQTMPGEDVHCGPWVPEWNISEGWWYYWWLRHCHNPSIEGEWHIEYDGWDWWGP